jgi:hypothetical protein
VFILKYACKGLSILTFLGTNKKLPPDHTLEFNAANLLSTEETKVPKYFFINEGCLA